MFLKDSLKCICTLINTEASAHFITPSIVPNFENRSYIKLLQTGSYGNVPKKSATLCSFILRKYKNKPFPNLDCTCENPRNMEINMLYCITYNSCMLKIKSIFENIYIILSVYRPNKYTWGVGWFSTCGFVSWTACAYTYTTLISTALSQNMLQTTFFPILCVLRHVSFIFHMSHNSLHRWNCKKA